MTNADNVKAIEALIKCAANSNDSQDAMRFSQAACNVGNVLFSLKEVTARNGFGDDDRIKYMVDRFLSWRLPEDFCPDAGISFVAEYNQGTAFPMKHEPVGTNLFTASQATEMVRYMIDGML